MLDYSTVVGHDDDVIHVHQEVHLSHVVLLEVYAVISFGRERSPIW